MTKRIRKMNINDPFFYSEIVNQPGMHEHPDFHRWATLSAHDRHAYTVLADEVPVASFGIRDIYDKRGEMWLLLSPKGQELGIWLARTGRIILQNLSKQYDRIESLIPVTWHTASRYLEHLGFKREAVLRKAGIGGLDAVMYVYIGEE